MESRNNIGLRSWASINFHLDRVDPTIEFGYGETQYSSDGIFDISWDFEESGPGLNKTFMIEFEGEIVYVFGKSHHLEIQEDGHYFFTITGWDLAGNKGTLSITLVKDSVAPILSLNIEDGGYVTNSPMAIYHDLDGTGSPPGRIMLSLDGSDPELVTNHPYYLYGLEEGEHTIKFEAWDMAWNKIERTIEFTVDTVNPTIIQKEPEGYDTPLDSIISLIFSEEVLIENITINGGYQEFILIENRVIISPEEEWDLSAGYDVAVYGTDLAGNVIQDNRFSFTTIGPGKVIGKVLDSRGRPLDRVKISIGDLEASSHVDGSFFIRGPEGSCILVFEKEGYDPFELIVNLENGDVVDIGNITLKKTDENESTILPFIIVVVLLVLIASAIGVFFVVFRKRKGLDHEDYDDMKEIMSGFGITRSPKEINCYEILGVRRGARGMEIKKAYRSKAALYHPDKQMGKEIDESDKMSELNAAKSILLDSEKREVHDRMLNHFR